MANKIFSIYKSGKERSAKNNDRLIVEISNSHVASVVIGGSSNVIEDFELFQLKTGSFKNFEENFAYAVIGSRLLDKPYADKKVFINSPEAVVVPFHLYSKQKSGDYLNVVFGNSNKQEVFKDDLINQFQAVLAYRLPAQVREVVEKNLAIVTLEHVYSSILRNCNLQLISMPANFLKVQVYKNHMIVVLFCDQRLQLIQSFSYANREDILYSLLNVCKQFELKDPSLEISGMTEANSALIEQLNTYFKKVSMEVSALSGVEISGYPAHYFTPFFKLAE